MITIELHRKSDHGGSNNDSFYRCHSCSNGDLMKGEYQAMINSVRECLPLVGRQIGRLGGSVIFQCDPIRLEHINGADQLKFLETCLKMSCGDFFQEERFFQMQSEIGTHGLQLDLVPPTFLKQEIVSSTSPPRRFRSVDNVLNGNPPSQWLSRVNMFTFTDMDP